MEVDTRKMYTWANQAGLDFFGDDVIGHEADDYFVGNQTTYRQVQPLFDGNEDIIYIESLQRRRDGQVRLLGWWCKVLKDSKGNATGALSTARDITDIRLSEQAVRESEERFRAIFNTSPEGIILADPDMKFIMVNESICVMTGYSREELVGMSVRDIHPPEQLAAVIEKFLALLNREISAAMDIPVRRKDGSVFFADIHAGPFIHNEKKYVAGFFLDISDRNRILEALQESETHFRAVVEASPMGMHIYRVEPGKPPVFVGYNPAAESILSLSHEQFLNKAILEAFPGLKGTDVPERYRRAALQGELWHNEQVEYRDNKIVGAFDVYAFRIKPGLMAAMFSDITNRKLMEEELRSQREFIDRIMATSPVCIVVVDVTGKITFANEEAERVLGLTRSDIRTRTYNDRSWRITDFNGNPLPEEDLPFRQVMKNGKPLANFQHAIERPDGRKALLSINGAPLTDARGKCSGVVFSINDITQKINDESQRRKLEEQVIQTQKMESIGRLAGGVAHDLNNLLTPIIGYADFCLTSGKGASGELAPIFRGILGAAERAKSLTRQLLAFSRKQPLEIDIINLNDIIRSIRTLLERTLRENIIVSVELSADACFIRADHSQIDQIILNLASNAQDALPGGGRLTIKTFCSSIEGGEPPRGSMPGPGAYAVLSIADNGQGMDRETLEHIFEPFFTTKDKGVGTGLGLATVYGIAKQHGGYIHVLSEPGSGTTFNIYFPAASGEPVPSPEPTSEGADAIPSAVILLVEDNDDVRIMTQRILASIGFDVIPAKNGRRALELFAEHPTVSLVITDVIMPEMNGVMLFQAIKSTHPLTKVLYMSGYTDDIITSHGALDQNAPLLMKPFTVRQLREKVRQVMQPAEES